MAITLRYLTYAGTTTVARELTFDEMDQNIIDLLALSNAQNSTIWIDSYDNGVVYSLNEFVTYGGLIYRYVNASSEAGRIPTSNIPDYWILVASGTLAHERNKDTILAEGTAFEVSAEELFGLSNFVEITYAALQSLKDGSPSAMVTGTNYKITDRGDAGIIVRAIDTDQLSLNGLFIAKNPDWQNTGGLFLGTWHSGLAPLVGELVNWNGYHYENLTGANGASNPVIDTTNWVQLAKTDLSYITEIDTCEYDFDNDWFQLRTDKRGNSGGRTYQQEVDSAIGDPIEAFQWGNDSVINNKFKGSYIGNTNNHWSSFKNNEVGVNGYLAGFTTSGEALVNNNTLLNDAVINSVTLAAGSYISGNTFCSDSTMVTINLAANAGIEDFFLSPGSFFQNKTLNSSVVLDTFKIGLSNNGTKTYTASKSEKRMEHGFSNESETISITGLTTINITANNSECGIIDLTSGNATETINLFSNFPTNIPVMFRPASGLTVTFTHATGANQPICAGAVDAVINGTNGDFIIFERRETYAGSGIYRIYNIDGQTF